MKARSEDREYRLWRLAQIAVVGGVALYWYIVTRELTDGRDWLALMHIVAFVVSGILGGIASLIGRFALDTREQYRLFNAVFLSCFLLSAFWIYGPPIRIFG